MSSSITRLVLAFGFLTAASVAGAQTPQPSDPPLDTAYVNYDSGPFSLPLGIGLRIPSYNRVDGVVIPWGPTVNLAGGKFVFDPTVTYRSHLGAFDPYGKATVRLGQRDELVVAGGRSTFTNDGWIRSDLINSLAALGVGSDARNYFRADRGTVELAHEITGRFVTVTPSIGMLHEYAWSTGTALRHSSAPWSALNRTDSLKMRRANPAIWKGHTTSGIAGAVMKYEQDVVTGSFGVRAEHAFDAPSLSSDKGDFTQLTFDSKAAFPTFGTQHFAFRGHGVASFGDDTPPQRWAYLGGAGTLATVDLLGLGGDRLLFVEGEYSVPLVRPLLPFVGPPVLSVRYAAGSAGVDRLPRLIQNIGVGVGVRLVKVEYHIDPSYKKTPFTHRSAFSIGFSLSL